MRQKNYIYGRRIGCTRCDRRWSVTSGTVLADTKLPPTRWFRAMHLMTSTKQGISAVELGRRIDVSYPTAWYVHKRLRHAMIQRGERHKPGAVPADDTPRPSQHGDQGHLQGAFGQTHARLSRGFLLDNQSSQKHARDDRCHVPGYRYLNRPH